MELKDIVAIAGQSGLHKIVGRTKNGLIVETIGSGRRFATSFQDKVSVLEDISIYTVEEDMRLNKVLLKLQASNDVPSAKADMKTVRKFLIETIELDSERVYDNDIKKLMSWFHALKDVLDFSKLEEPEEDEEIVATDEVAGAAGVPKATKKVKAGEADAEVTEEAKPKKVAVKKAAAPKNAAPKNVATKTNSKGAGGSKTTYRSKTV
ncbi:MAG: DUF5606 domain-containing protein [Bacteroidia bacterium]|nr:DUF5606 domain-containing protein [Bacteroidia bacterium]